MNRITEGTAQQGWDFCSTNALTQLCSHGSWQIIWVLNQGYLCEASKRLSHHLVRRARNTHITYNFVKTFRSSQRLACG